MGTATRLSAMRLGGMMVVWRSAVLIPGELFGGDTDQAVPGPSANPANVSLTAPGTIEKLSVVSKRAAGVPPLPTRQDIKGLASPTPSQRPAPTPGAPARPKSLGCEFDPFAGQEQDR